MLGTTGLIVNSIPRPLLSLHAVLDVRGCCLIHGCLWNGGQLKLLVRNAVVLAEKHAEEGMVKE